MPRHEGNKPRRGQALLAYRRRTKEEREDSGVSYKGYHHGTAGPKYGRKKLTRGAAR